MSNHLICHPRCFIDPHGTDPNIDGSSNPQHDSYGLTFRWAPAGAMPAYYQPASMPQQQPPPPQPPVYVAAPPGAPGQPPPPPQVCDWLCGTMGSGNQASTNRAIVTLGLIESIRLPRAWCTLSLRLLRRATFSSSRSSSHNNSSSSGPSRKGKGAAGAGCITNRGRHEKKASEPMQQRMGCR